MQRLLIQLLDVAAGLAGLALLGFVASIRICAMKHLFLPPTTHPRLYAREYLRLRPLIDGLAFLACLFVGVPVAGWVFLWICRLAFAL